MTTSRAREIAGLPEALALPPSIRNRLDRFVADIARQSYAAGKRAGERAAVRRVTALLNSPAGPAITEIQRAVADAFGTDLAEMKSQRRARAVAWPRHVAMYLARQMTPHSLPMIGRHFGGRDHTTVMHAIHKVESRAAADMDVARVLSELRERLTTRAA